MKKGRIPFVVSLVAAALLLAVLLYFLHPLAPLLLLLSVAIQAPIIWAIIRSTRGSAYNDRVHARKQQYAEDQDAATWLEQEEAESRSVGFEHWSRRGKNRNTLLRAWLAHQLGRTDEAQALLPQIDPNRLEPDEKAYYQQLTQRQDSKT